MRIGVVARFDIDKSVELAGKIVEFLIEKDVDTLIDTNLASKLNKYHDIASDLEDMDVDMVVAVGGDGTVLRTQGIINQKKIPLFGINMGACLLYTSPSPRDGLLSRMPSSA